MCFIISKFSSWTNNNGSIEVRAIYKCGTFRIKPLRQFRLYLETRQKFVILSSHLKLVDVAGI